MCIRTVTYMCRRGHYYSEHAPQGIQSDNGWCHPCGYGSFMDSEEHNLRECRPCRTCNSRPNEYYRRQCNSIADSECASCPPGELAETDGGCRLPTTRSLTDPATTSASTKNAETTAKTTVVATATSSDARNSLTSNGPTPSMDSHLSQAASAGSGNDSGLVTSAHWPVHNHKYASASHEDDASSVVNLTTASTAVIVDESLKAGTPFTMTADDVVFDARFTALAVVSVTSTVTLFAIAALWLKRRDRARHGSSSATLSCCSCASSSHVYQEPGEYDVTYLEAPLPSNSDRSSISAASYGISYTYDYARPCGSSHSAGNTSVKCLFLNGARDSPGERVWSQLPASDTERRHHWAEAGCTLHPYPGEFFPSSSEVTHLRCDIEPTLNDTACNGNSHSTGEGAICCADKCCTTCGQPLHFHNAISQHAQTSACERIYAEIN